MSDDRRTQHRKVIAKAVSDEAFKAKLLSDPHAALKEIGIEVPAGKSVNFVADTESLVHIVLPAINVEGELSEEQLDAVVGGTTSSPDNPDTWNPSKW